MPNKTCSTKVYATGRLFDRRVAVCGLLHPQFGSPCRKLSLRITESGQPIRMELLETWPSTAYTVLEEGEGSRSWTLEFAHPPPIAVLHLKASAQHPVASTRTNSSSASLHLCLPLPFSREAEEVQVARCCGLQLTPFGDPHPLPPLLCFVATQPDFGVGGRVWGGARWIAGHLHAFPELVAGRMVLELGAGTGLAGLAAARLGARAVALTDLHTLLPMIELNVMLNKQTNAGGRECATVVLPLAWGDDDAEHAALAWLSRHSASPTQCLTAVDVLIVAECIYQPSNYDALLCTICRVSDENTTVLIGYRGTGQVLSHNSFWQRLAEHFDWHEVGVETAAAHAAAIEMSVGSGDDLSTCVLRLMQVSRRSVSRTAIELEAFIAAMIATEQPNVENGEYLALVPVPVR